MFATFFDTACYVCQDTAHFDYFLQGSACEIFSTSRVDKKQEHIQKEAI